MVTRISVTNWHFTPRIGIQPVEIRVFIGLSPTGSPSQIYSCALFFSVYQDQAYSLDVNLPRLGAPQRTR
jgi:hypothetical protein